MSDVIGEEREEQGTLVRDADVLEMRRTFYNDGAIDQFEADKLIARFRSVKGESGAWDAFFIEALVDFTVNQMTPRGYVTQAQAQWLVDSLAEDGQVRTATELELLCTVIEQAIDVPDTFAEFVLIQIGEAILAGDRALLRNAAAEAGVIGGAEVALLSRVIHAMAGGSGIGVSRAEAEVLVDLNDASDAARNAPAWDDFFVKAIINHLMAAHGFAAVDREEALRRAAWLDEPGDGVTGILAKMFAGDAQALRSAYVAADTETMRVQHLARAIREIEGAEIIDADEGRWLAARFNRDGVLRDNEKAVLRFIRDEAPEIAGDLEPLFAQI